MEEKEMILNIVKKLQLKEKSVISVINLHKEGNTVPFIARYRKEMTGSLDEVQIKDILDTYQYETNLSARKDDVLRSIEEKGKLTEELRISIEKAKKLQEVEDLYRPYKEKRRTRATIAKEKGLEPLAELIWEAKSVNILEEAKKYLSEAVSTVEDAIAGAKDIMAEMISDDPAYRQYIRQFAMKNGVLQTKVKSVEKDSKKVYEMYYDYQEPVIRLAPHRVLAINRGEKEEVIKVSLELPKERIYTYLEQQICKKHNEEQRNIMKETIEDAFLRLIQPSIEREIRKELTGVAENQAINVFSKNLQSLLLQPPLKGKCILGVDPAFRTGCKLAVVDDTGKLLYIDVIYPHPPKAKVEEAKKKFLSILSKFPVEMVAIGNGTASRETEQFVATCIKESEKELYYLIVNEAGASVYSASEVAREEFPNLQVEERSAVSIARRLQDPLAELVKIDPKSIGVGQYQHDVNQKGLQESLQFVVETAVNKVGVNVNTASASLLQYVSGLSKTVAQNVVKAREENGKFVKREQLKKIPRLGAKTYEQCIGFLRIMEGKQPLDRTPIHPESYKLTEQLLAKIGFTTKDIGTEEVKLKLEKLDARQLAEELLIGEETLKDIIDALIRPERDPRDEMAKPQLKTDVLKMEDLVKGMELEGTVRNVVDFGVFIDIGLKSDGLVHKSKMKKGFVKHPLDVVSVGDIVTVWVEDIDTDKGRVSLTMLSN